MDPIDHLGSTVYNYIVWGGRRPRDGKGPASACDTRARPAVKPDREDLAPDPTLDRSPYTAADLDWAAVAMNEHATDYDVEIDPFEQLDPEEFHAWLDSIAPTEGELEARDRTDCGFGHQA